MWSAIIRTGISGWSRQCAYTCASDQSGWTPYGSPYFGFTFVTVICDGPVVVWPILSLVSAAGPGGRT